MSPRSKKTSGTLVVGIGRFGAAVAVTLERLGFEVLAMEKHHQRVQHFAGILPIVQGDGTDVDALEQAGAEDFSSAVVGVGGSLEASVLVTANLVDLGIKSIWAKATSREHGRILRRIGAHHVVYPEYDAGQRTAHLVGGQMLDYIEMDKSEFVIAKLRPPRELEGFTVAESQIQTRFGVRVIAILRAGKPFKYAHDDTRVEREDVLVVSGSSLNVLSFAERPR